MEQTQALLQSEYKVRKALPFSIHYLYLFSVVHSVSTFLYSVVWSVQCSVQCRVKYTTYSVWWRVAYSVHCRVKHSVWTQCKVQHVVLYYCTVQSTMCTIVCNVHCRVWRTVHVQFSTNIDEGHYFVHTDTTIQLDLTSNTTHLPNFAPYNTLFLTCTATVPQGVVVPKIFAWRRRTGPSTTDLIRLANSSNSMLITSTNLDLPTSTSVLTVRETIPGDYRYRCRVDLSELPFFNKTDLYPINITGERCLRI